MRLLEPFVLGKERAAFVVPASGSAHSTPYCHLSAFVQTT